MITLTLTQEQYNNLMEAIDRAITANSDEGENNFGIYDDDQLAEMQAQVEMWEVLRKEIETMIDTETDNRPVVVVENGVAREVLGEVNIIDIDNDESWNAEEAFVKLPWPKVNIHSVRYLAEMAAADGDWYELAAQEFYAADQDWADFFESLVSN